jgi:hypothetical protein
MCADHRLAELLVGLWSKLSCDEETCSPHPEAESRAIPFDMVWTVSENPDGTWSIRDGWAVIGPFSSRAQAWTQAVEHERLQGREAPSDAEAAGGQAEQDE